MPTSKEIKNVSNCLSDAGGLNDCGKGNHYFRSNSITSSPPAWPVAQGVLQHHERLDGSGYPSGVTAGEITPEAKILAVADVVEAMASHRPYRPALGIEKALEEITQNRGKLYDPDAVDVWGRLLTEKDFRFD
ncbi:MAG: HD domain-containing protein [Desulfobacterales bacterium]|nr:HD domain-containing protein [Desulfobacterales bacterium]